MECARTAGGSFCGRRPDWVFGYGSDPRLRPLISYDCRRGSRWHVVTIVGRRGAKLIARETDRSRPRSTRSVQITPNVRNDPNHQDHQADLTAGRSP
jgi:hypothetical protein